MNSIWGVARDTMKLIKSYSMSFSGHWDCLFGVLQGLVQSPDLSEPAGHFDGRWNPFWTDVSI